MRRYATCPTCGKRYIPYWDREHCSMQCYRNRCLFPRLGITAEDVKECHGMTMKDAAAVLGVSYKQLRRKVCGTELRQMFPNRGEGKWMATRGYA